MLTYAHHMRPTAKENRKCSLAKMEKEKGIKKIPTFPEVF
jgi:hypothetical protein